MFSSGIVECHLIKKDHRRSGVRVIYWMPMGQTNPAALRALIAAGLGYMLDAMDVLLYVFALQTLRGVFGLSNAQAGLISAATLATSAIGGIAAGVLSDRFG